MFEKSNKRGDIYTLLNQKVLQDIAEQQPLTTILVVDDEEVMRNLLTDVLQNEGYTVYALSTAEAALEKMTETNVDIIITDVRMKGMNGIDLLKKVKALGTEIDVVVMTGYTSIQTAVDSMKLGAVDYLTKPLNIDQIKFIVYKCIQQRYLKKEAIEAQFYKQLAQTDGLTELFNHRFFQELTAIELSRANREQWNLTIAMLDIDDFKEYNDKNGHPMGDLALKKFAWLLKNNCRCCDFIARYGGEEFVIILPNTSKKEAKILSARLLKKIEEATFENEHVMPKGKLTVSIGLASYPEDAKTREELIEKADQALYRAKKKGKNTICS